MIGSTANFNRKSIEPLPVEQFHEIAAGLNIQVCARPDSKAGGLALTGFYAPAATWALKRPLIYVNMTYHL